MTQESQLFCSGALPSFMPCCHKGVHGLMGTLKMQAKPWQMVSCMLYFCSIMKIDSVVTSGLYGVDSYTAFTHVQYLGRIWSIYCTTEKVSLLQWAGFKNSIGMRGEEKQYKQTFWLESYVHDSKSHSKEMWMAHKSIYILFSEDASTL